MSVLLACPIPRNPRVRRLTLCLEGRSVLRVGVWLGRDDDGAQLELAGPVGRPWKVQEARLGGVDVFEVCAAVSERFAVPILRASEVERLLMRTGAVASIAAEASGIEGLHDLERLMEERLTAPERLVA